MENKKGLTMRIVIKVGTSTLAHPTGRLNIQRIELLCKVMSDLKNAGHQIILVSSGAIAMGFGKLNLPERPKDVPTKQASAAVGQCELMYTYDKLFTEYNHTVAQILLTGDDVEDPDRAEHLRSTFSALLELGCIPIVNENDTVSVEQIRFGDNDTLAALVACLIDADLMVILSDIDGLYTANPQIDPAATLIPVVDRVGRDILAAAGGAVSGVGSGGMITKIKAARVLMAAGIPMVICQGRRADCIVQAAAGEAVGTLFTAPDRPHEITAKKLWIALGDSVHGTVVVDEGARDALVMRGKSLLSVGIRAVEGDFGLDDIVDVADETGHVFARGRAAAASDLLKLACGRSREEVASNAILAVLADRPVIHRDELVLFE